MRQTIRTGLLTTALSLGLLAYSACAQAKCVGHLMAKGECVSKPAAGHARRSGVILSQPKISGSAYPVLPSADSNYRYPNQLTTTPGGVTRIR